MDENLLMAQGILADLQNRMAGGLSQEQALAQILGEAPDDDTPSRPEIREFPAIPAVPGQEALMFGEMTASLRRQTEHYEQEARRLRQEREAMEQGHQAQLAQLQAQQQAQMRGQGAGGIAEWDTKSLRHLDPATMDGNISVGDLGRLSDEQWVALATGDQGRNRMQAIAGLLSDSDRAERAALADAQAPDPRVSARLEEMSAHDLYQALGSGHGGTVLSALSDMARSSTPASPRPARNFREDGGHAA
ncbi:MULTISPECIES: hypothetical protein [Cyanophyceae]|uniref:Uncharacterized protein n=1 Tax=Leptolyngbya subtilissima DQ-A4 TaxID=2933933 RepID=A0ABV0KEJ8_9CYAN|nr:hypothetical protein [Nodosilinea sp. FACHB-141]MBD2115250.1 hypothetical protein [Nodosilinea sp. FACHB-141]